MRLAVLFLSMILLGLLTACDDGTIVDPPPSTKGQVSGHVWHRLFPEQILEGVQVSWGSASDLTDAEGEYVLSDLDAGGDSLKLSLSGYHAESTWLQLDGDSLVESFTLMPIDTDPPLPPISLSAETEDGAYIVLHWEAPEDETRTGFALWKTPGDPHFQILAEAVDSLLDIQVAPLRDYIYTLQCRDAYGNLSEPLEISIEVDTYPSYSVIEVLPEVGFESIPLQWTENTDADFSRYRLYRSGGSNADSLDLLIYEGLENSYTDEDLEANEVFSYRVYNYDLTGNVTTHSKSEVDAAAQIMLPDFSEFSDLLAQPDGQNCWVIGKNTGTIRVVSSEGEVLDTLPPFTGPAFWTHSHDGSEALGVGTIASRFSRVSLDPLVETDTFEHDYGDFSDLAWLNENSVVLSSQVAGAPLIMDVESFAIVDMLNVLSDTEISARLIMDPVAQILYVADFSGTGRLRAVDMSGDPAIVQEVVLPGSPSQMRISADGELLLVYLGVRLAERRLLADLDNVVLSIDLEGSPDRAFFTPDETQLWLSDFESRLVTGINMDNGELIRELTTIRLPLDIQVLAGGTRVFVAQTSNYVSILAVDRGND
jgi:hypothetical protein